MNLKTMLFLNKIVSKMYNSILNFFRQKRPKRDLDKELSDAFDYLIEQRIITVATAQKGLDWALNCYPTKDKEEHIDYYTKLLRKRESELIKTRKEKANEVNR